VVTTFEPGDVFITKLYKWVSPALNIRKIGMAVLSHHRKSSASSAHAGIFVNDSKFVHIMSMADCEDVATSDFSQYPNVVWRCQNAKLAELATQVALRLAGFQGLAGLASGPMVFLCLGNRPNCQRPVFDEGNAIRAVFKSRLVTGDTKKYLSDLAAQLADQPGGVSITDMFCAEFVVAAYEIASQACGARAFGVDPRSADPKFLESLLNQRSRVFQLVGRFGKAG
jgi:hypothetical protein